MMRWMAAAVILSGMMGSAAAEDGFQKAGRATGLERSPPPPVVVYPPPPELLPPPVYD